MAYEYGRNRTQESVEARLAPVVSEQHGVFTRQQAFEAGATDGLIHRRLASRRWERLYAGVYRLAGATASWLQSLTGASLAKGPASVVSHLSAAALARLPGFDPGPIELIVPRTHRRNTIPDIVVRRVDLPTVDITRSRNLRVTTVARTLIDIASVSSPELVEEAIDDALRRGLVSRARLRWQVSEMSSKGRRGISIVRAILADREGVAPVPRSVFETKALRKLRAAGIPDPVRQHEIRDGGRHVATVDFALPDLRIAIEADGFRWHGSRLRFQHDLARRNAITALKWELFHLTWADLEDRESEAINTIVRVFRSRRRIDSG
jgi:very-short-patch-repair endonuclease